MSNVFQMSTQINGRNYAGIKCGVYKALGLASTLSPVIIATVSGKDITSAIAGNLLENTAKSLLEGISCDGKAMNPDTHFVSYPEDLLPVIAWSAKEQVLPYFSAEALQSIFLALGLGTEGE